MQLHLALSMKQGAGHVHPAGHHAAIAALLVMCRFLCGPGFTPLEIHSIRERSICAESLEHLVGQSIEFNSAKNLLIFDRIHAEQRLATGSSELAKVNEDVARKYLIYIDRNSIVMLVMAAIVEMLPTGKVTEESIADTLNLSVRTLQRKLSEQGTSFAAVYQSLRQDMAQQYIQDSQMSITEIAYLLGFSEQSNFTRAFRRWYGISPSSARRQFMQSTFV